METSRSAGLGSRVCDRGEPIGYEYIISAEGEGFFDNKLYFVCLLCSDMERDSSELASHLSSYDHQLKFLVIAGFVARISILKFHKYLFIQETHFQKIMNCVLSIHEAADKETLQKIMNCVINEISRNVEKREINIYNYLDYEENSDETEQEILSKIVPYDESLEYITQIITVLKTMFPTALTESIQKESEDIGSNTMISGETTESNLFILSDPVTVDASEEENEGSEGNSEEDPMQSKDFIDISTPAVISGEASVVHTIVEEQSKRDDNEVAILDLQTFAEENQFKDIQRQDNTLIAINSQYFLELQRNEALISMYNERLKRITNELDRRYEYDLKNPAHSSSFVQEWKNFYISESFKIAANGEFNYLEAWSAYWQRHIEQLKHQELQERSFYLKKQLNIPPSLMTQRGLKSKFSEFSDISDDEFENQTPQKRLKLEPLVRSRKTYTELDRMTIAYDLAFEHLQAGQRLSPKELLNLVKVYCGCEQGKESQQIMNLTDNDLIMIHKNFKDLDKKEQKNYLSYLSSLELTQPDRYKLLEEKIKKEH